MAQDCKVLRRKYLGVEKLKEIYSFGAEAVETLNLGEKYISEFKGQADKIVIIRKIS